MSAAEIAMQPAVGVRPGRARWKKIALPRPFAHGEILVEDEGQIIKMILAPHPVRALGGGQADGTVLAPALRVLAPALIAPHALRGPLRLAVGGRSGR